MRIIRFLDPDGREAYGIPGQDGTAQRLQGELLEGLSLGGGRVPIARLLAPLVPCNIFCIGLNYPAHAAETGAQVPEHPVVFMKPTSALNHPGGPIPIPAACEHGPEVDFEAELAVVIGRRARDVAERTALSHVLGYTAANDVSARRWQRHGGGGQWIRGKGFDGFCPLGPALVTADEISDPQTLRVRSILNGVPMQDGHTSTMLYPVARLISLLSRDTTLLPGTLILTGTPPGVGCARSPPVFLMPGDTIVVEVEGIGQLENPVVAAFPSSAPP
jgi:2-keto-4-pentenoate hydratase/2-oxohepta-3-ene-1,7-dioic acid hydratase in catechol pathway